jgi:DNA topoisomerase-2
MSKSRKVPITTEENRVVVAKSTKTATQEDKKMSHTYKKLSERDHILLNPDVYVGSAEKNNETLYVLNPETLVIEQKTIEYNPALYKLFDEVIINARDHILRIIASQNDTTDETEKAKIKNVSYINVEVDEKTGRISIENDGDGIPIMKHPEHDIWIPELIFAHLRTSTNYNKEEKRIVGGKNGFGVKLVFIWSVWGQVETVDCVRGLRYVQTFDNNLDKIGEPVITKLKGVGEMKKPYTRVSFIPDYTRLGISSDGGNILGADLVALFRKRVYDIAGVSDHSVKKVALRYNSVPIPVRNFTQYIEQYIGKEKKVYEECGPRWEYSVSMSQTGEFTQVSFVNGICTYKGGKHVDYLIGQITRKLSEYIETKKKVRVTAGTIKEQLIVFLRCDIENPTFSSQTKDYLELPASKFGSLPTVSDEFIEKVAKLGVMAQACALTAVKDEKMAKKTDGVKSRVVRGIDNLTDANNAGTTRSKDCILYIVEGLSAKSAVISALNSESRSFIGVYPIKGKLMNVRGETIGKVSANKEITELKRVLGLENGKDYKDVSSLRYGRIRILTDQDPDASHIRALIINLFATMWPSLYKMEGFLSFMNTPILRATPKSKKDKTPLFFYNVGEFNQWVNNGGRLTQYDIKYYKGLGTSTAQEFKKYFEDDKNVNLVYSGPVSDESIDKVFNKKRPDDRKDWLLTVYDKNLFLNTSESSATYEKFVDNELIHFSNYDCLRSIPNVMDGLKISLRKILYVMIKNNITSEIKVAQLGAKVSEMTHYSHGEKSLMDAIIGMAQQFVGSNNLNLIQPLGQFGSRLCGGDDSASERYIFTCLSNITKKLFREEDNAILTYVNDDGYIVEPEYYVPILPYVLINTCRGIGTGFSTSILPMNPLDIIRYVRAKLLNEETPIAEFVPYYEGFTGLITNISKNRYLVKGKYEIDGDNVKITELPIETWTDPYKKMLDELAEPTVDKSEKKVAPLIKDFIDMSTDKIINIVVQFAKGDVERLVGNVDKTTGINGLEKLLKLTTTISNTNMYLYDEKLKLHKFDSVEEIIDHFMDVRMIFYEKRKTYMIEHLKQQLVVLSNKARFIKMCLDGVIDLRRKTNDEIDELMETHSFNEVDNSFDYLIKIPMNSVSKENIDKILKDEANKREELETLVGTSLNQLWLNDLQEFETEYVIYKQMREETQKGGIENKVIAGKKGLKKKTT